MPQRILGFGAKPQQITPQILLKSLKIRSRAFKKWLCGEVYAKRQGALNTQAEQEAINTLDAKARFGGARKPVFVRLGSYNGNIYIGLGDADWRAVEVAPDGWEVVPNSPAKFVRPRGMKPLPVPARGGSIEELRQFLNTKNEDDFKLVVAWLIGAFQPDGPYPILDLDGEQGSGKSTASRMLCSLIDPREASPRSAPREERDLVIAAKDSWLIAFDNLSRVPDWLSDALCRISTGGGFGTRQLFTDAEEILFTGKRPILLNGIPPLANRSDLADRTISVTLQAMVDGARKTERQLWAEFDATKPRIFGAILDAVSMALMERDSVNLKSPPRMADFAAWIVAAEPALGWPEGAFLDAYSESRETATERAIEASAIGPAIIKLMEGRNHWEGSPTELLTKLEMDGVSEERASVVIHSVRILSRVAQASCL